jgi:hypothetical protein
MLSSVSVGLVWKLEKSEDVPTRVACRTLAKRGKSLVPESRILMEESSSCILERRDETQLERVLAVLMLLNMCELMVVFIVDGRKQSACEMRETLSRDAKTLNQRGRPS